MRIVYLCLHFNNHFSTGACINQYQNVCILGVIGAKDDGVGGDNWSYNTCEAPVELSPTNQHSSVYSIRATRF